LLISKENAYSRDRGSGKNLISGVWLKFWHDYDDFGSVDYLSRAGFERMKDGQVDFLILPAATQPPNIDLNLCGFDLHLHSG
jgi:hypothetical protein